jgi:hypothetical protein
MGLWNPFWHTSVYIQRQGGGTRLNFPEAASCPQREGPSALRRYLVVLTSFGLALAKSRTLRTT